MATVEKFGRVKGGGTLSQTHDDVTIEEPWKLVLRDPALIGEVYVLLDSLVGDNGFPDIEDPYSDDLSGVICVDRSIEHYQEQRNIFIITVKYSNTKEDTEGENGDPLDKPTVYTYTAVDNQKVVEKDTRTKKIISYTNGRPVIPPFTENFPLTRVTANRNEANFNNYRISSLQSKINSGGMSIEGRSYGKGTVQFENVSATTQYMQDGTKYYSVTYTLLINVEGFKRKVINADNFHLVKDGETNKLTRTKDGTVKKLDKNGALLADEQQLDPESFEELEFDTLEFASMNGLRL